MSYYYIVNPAAGRGLAANLEDKLRTRLQELGIAGEFVKTTGENDATKIAKAAAEKGFTTIVAVGGDGTVNEVINGLRGADAAVGIIPTGRSNSLATHFGITNWQQACDVLSARRITTYALIAAGQKYFLSDLDLGFELDPDALLDQPEGGRLSRFRTNLQHLTSTHSTSPISVNIKVDEAFEVDADVTRLNITNQKFRDPLADNRLIVSMYDAKPKHHTAKALWQQISGREAAEEHPSSRFFAKRLVVNSTPSVAIMIDGKVAGRTPIAIRLTDRRIRLITEKQIANIKATF